MTITKIHSILLAHSLEKLLGCSDSGSMAFIRCLTPDVVNALASDHEFSPKGWIIRRVADIDDQEHRTITADQAVEIRESKDTPIVLLVDTLRAGAGMDGIYSAAREVEETGLFQEALRLAAYEITKKFGKNLRDFTERAVKKARGFRQRYSISPWQEFDFYVRVLAGDRNPGELIWRIGLWPILAKENDLYNCDTLDASRLFVDKLLGMVTAGHAPFQRIESLGLLNPSEIQRIDLEQFLHSAGTRPLLMSLEKLTDFKHLWVNELKRENGAHVIQKIDLVPWRTRQGKLAKWSGLID